MSPRIARAAELPAALAERAFFEALRSARLPIPDAEYRFAPPRKWAFDYAWITQRIALEVERGAWTRGRHTRGVGYMKDLIKYNEASVRGWTLIRVTPQMFVRPETVELVQRAIVRWRAE